MVLNNACSTRILLANPTYNAICIIFKHGSLTIYWILNCSKCKVMINCRVNSQFAACTLKVGSLDRITLVNDLGVLLDPRLKFSDHISSMMNKGRGALGFNKRLSKKFDDFYISKTLFIWLSACTEEFYHLVLVDYSLFTYPP